MRARQLRLHRHAAARRSVPEISSADSIVPTDAFTTGTSTTVAAGAVVSGAASAVVDDEPQPASEQGRAQDDGNTNNRKPGE